MVRSIVFAFLLVYVSGRPVLPVPEFKINLDLDPEERFKEVISHFYGVLNDLIKHEASSFLIKKFYKKIAQHRGPENDELAGEIRGIAKYSNIPVEAIQAGQLLYELQTIMIPFENISWPWGETTHRSSSMPTFGCTGVIARSADDGTVTHARNLDFSFAKWLGNMTYNGVFYKGGQELYTAQMIAGYQAVVTGMRPGKNGYTIEINTRFPPKTWNIDNLMNTLFKEKRITSGWIKRKVLETIDNFEDAVEAFSTRPYATTEYNIISGKQKGIILARNPDSVYHTQTLGPNKNDYIVITNFDFWDNDRKEWLDPTSTHFGHSRRIGVETLLNKSNNVNYHYLYKVMNDDEVVAKDTIFQMFANVEKDSYKTFLPDCKDCSGCAETGECREDPEGCCDERSYKDRTCGIFGGYKCGCIPDGTCRDFFSDSKTGDQDCCSFESHFSMECPGSFRRCGPSEHVDKIVV